RIDENPRQVGRRLRIEAVAELALRGECADEVVHAHPSLAQDLRPQIACHRVGAARLTDRLVDPGDPAGYLGDHLGITSQLNPRIWVSLDGLGARSLDQRHRLFVAADGHVLSLAGNPLPPPDAITVARPTPADVAMSSTEVATYPCSAKSLSAASSTSMRVDRAWASRKGDSYRFLVAFAISSD